MSSSRNTQIMINATTMFKHPVSCYLKLLETPLCRAEILNKNCEWALGLRESKLKCKLVKLAISAGNMQTNGLLTLFNVVQFIVLPTDTPYLGATGIHSQEWNSGANAKQSEKTMGSLIFFFTSWFEIGCKSVNADLRDAPLAEMPPLSP